MDRRAFLRTVGVGLCAAAAGCVSSETEAAGKPNIILCMADDQGWGDMAYNGHPALKTPHFDAMAREAMRFDRFYAAAPVCSPTRASVMTGRHPNRMGCFSWGNSLRPQEITVAEALKKAGYVTGHFGKWHLGSVIKGSPVSPGAKGFDEWLSAPNFFDNDPILSRGGKAVQMTGESSMVTVDAALDFIRKHANGEKPFLAVVWFGSPHAPHKAAKEDLALYPDQPKDLANFYGEITGMDRAFGKLRKAIDELGIRENTILWYCSDNGGLPKVGTTGGRGNKGDIYEGGLRVPALLEWPSKVGKAFATEVPCNTCDIYPTLLEVAGVKMDGQPPLDGVSLVPLIGRKTEKRSKPMGFWQYPSAGIRTPSEEWMTELLEKQKSGGDERDPARILPDAGRIAKKYPENAFPGHAAWLDWPWKLHRIQGEKGNVRWELYDLSKDPGEQRDLAEKHPEKAASMRKSLESWTTSVVRSLNGKDYR